MKYALIGEKLGHSMSKILHEKYFEIKGDTAGRFTWDVMGEESVLTDPEGFQKLSPEEVLSELFAE